MKQKNKQRKENGITLIALVITIIVMLILVGVTINIVAEGKLFNYARDAKGRTANAITDERGLANVDLEASITGKEKLVEIHNWTKTGDQVTCSHCNLTLTIGQEIAYEEGGSASTTVSGEKSGIKQAIDNPEGMRRQDLNVEVDGVKILANGDQVVTKDSDVKWVVVGIEDQNNNGINETLLITTFKPNTDTVYLYGATAYNNIVTIGENIGILDELCKNLYGKNARGMTIEDVNNCLECQQPGGLYGSREEPAEDEWTYNHWRYWNDFTTNLKDLPIWNEIKDSHYTPNGENTEETLGKYTADGYFYFLSQVEATNRVKNVVCGERTDGEDWSDFYLYVVSGRTVLAGFGGTGFCLTGVSGPAIGSMDMNVYESDGWNHFPFDVPFRPVVSLTSNIPTAGEILFSDSAGIEEI